MGWSSQCVSLCVHHRHRANPPFPNALSFTTLHPLLGVLISQHGPICLCFFQLAHKPTTTTTAHSTRPTRPGQGQATAPGLRQATAPGLWQTGCLLHPAAGRGPGIRSAQHLFRNVMCWLNPSSCNVAKYNHKCHPTWRIAPQNFFNVQQSNKSGRIIMAVCV